MNSGQGPITNGPVAGVPGASVDPEAYRALVHLLIAEAREQVNSQLAAADAQSAKSLGIVAADLAGIALVVASRTALNRFWLATIVGLVVSAVGLFAPIVARSMADGPEVVKFYEEHVGRDIATAQYDLYRELATSLAENKRTLGGWRSVSFRLGVLAIVVTAVGSAVYLPVVH